MKIISQLVIAAFAVSATGAFAQSSANQGYLVDGNGGIVKSGSGLCWHNAEWNASRGVEPCDPAFKPYVAPVAAVAPAPQPEPVAQPAQTAPIAPGAQAEPAKVLPLPVPVPHKISFSGDALFAFGQATLKPEGEKMLDGLVRQLDGATFDTILATGHTDRFGTHAYNQKLSVRRAETVKAYLVARNIRTSRIDAEGKGETEPMTKANECRGAKSVQVVACLQPNRRVDIEMRGTKTSSL